jgi:hypothetical protein
MVKGAISLVVLILLVAVLYWTFWMTKEWLRNPENKSKRKIN